MSLLRWLTGRQNQGAAAVDSTDQCAKCRKPVGNKFFQDQMLRRYGNNPEQWPLIATSMIFQDDPHRMQQAEALGAGGFNCSKCQKKYCGECGGRMDFVCCATRLWIGTHYLHGHDTPSVDLVVSCPSCKETYHLGVDAAVVTAEGVAADFSSASGKVAGGARSDPDLVGPYSAPRVASAETIAAVKMLQRARTAGAPRHWKCQPCGSVNRYPWMRS